MNARPWLSILSLAICMPAAASAGDFFVDVAIGDDALGIGSPASPWKTITHALQQSLGVGDVVHVAPGVYAPSTGEQFPGTVDDGVTLIGAGPGASILDGESNLVSLLRVSGRVEGFTMEHAGSAVGFCPGAADWPGCQAELANVHIRDVLTAVSVGASIRDYKEGIVEDALIENCATGLSASGVSGRADLTSNRTRIINCSLAMDVFAISPAQGIDGGAGISMAHGEIRDCVTGAIAEGELSQDPFGATEYAVAGVYFTDSLITGCTDAIRLDSASDFFLRHSTMAGNVRGSTTVPGPDADQAFNLFNHANVWGNTEIDVDGVIIQFGGGYSNLPFSLGGTYLSVDPQFVDAAGGDFHLLPTSPLIDAGELGELDTGVDSDGDPRTLDGNLDGSLRLDIGYDEFNHVALDVTGDAVSGGTLQLTVGGPPTWFYCHFVALDQGEVQLAQLGALLLDLAQLITVGCQAGPGGPSVGLPVHPLVPELDFWFQSLGWDPVTGLGSFSNRVLR